MEELQPGGGPSHPCLSIFRQSSVPSHRQSALHTLARVAERTTRRQAEQVLLHQCDTFFESGTRRTLKIDTGCAITVSQCANNFIQTLIYIFPGTKSFGRQRGVLNIHPLLEDGLWVMEL